MSDGDAIISGDGPYTLLAQSPEMYLQYRADGTVWCRWPDGVWVEVVRKSDAPAPERQQPLFEELAADAQRDYREMWEMDQGAKKDLFEQREQFRRRAERLAQELEDIARQLEGYAEFSPADELRRKARAAVRATP